METNELFDLQDDFKISWYGGYTLYQLPYHKSLTNTTLDKNINVTSEKIVKEETKYNELICRDKSKWGYLFDSVTARKAQKINIDSFRIKKLLKNFPFYTKNNDVLVQSTLNGKKNLSVEKHIYKYKKDNSYFDSIYYYFDKDYVNINYSFCKELDSTRHSKLVKIRLIYNKIPNGNHGKDIPRREFLFEIKKSKDENANELVNFINLFKSKEKELYTDN